MEHESNGNTNYCWSAWNNPQKLAKEAVNLEIEGWVGNRRTSRDHLNIVKIGQKKRPTVLMGLAVTQTTLEDYQLTLVWKTHNE